jgi:hypothetical protein
MEPVCRALAEVGSDNGVPRPKFMPMPGV